MKRKYYGIVSVVLLLVLPLLVGVYYKTGAWRQIPSFTDQPVQPLTSDSWVPSEDQMKTIDALMPLLGRLAEPMVRERTPSPLLIFGQRGAYAASFKNPDPKGEEKASYNLSMTLLAGPIRYCIVDGDFVQEGSKLADGAAVIKIDKQRVLIAKDLERQWVHLHDPLMDGGQMREKHRSIHFNQRKDKS